MPTHGSNCQQLSHLGATILDLPGQRTMAPGSQAAQKACSPVVFDVVFHLIEAHGVAQGQVVGASLH